ncbi:MAG: 1-deoxy-D-xylulose-5-phosphate synthase, partial [Oscillospiraceae bacterium]
MGRILDDNFDLAKLKALDSSRLPQLCREIRQELIEVVSRNGGHLASNLGSVEICVAADRVFDSPRDTIIFDVGHQSYTHKLLTGRYKDFRTLRKEGGLSGFPKPCESEHDPFVEGHSGPALSEGLGVARARQQTGKPGKTVVVIGDGSFTNGMVYEAINNLSSDLDDLIVILNDNSMSISKSVGAMARYLLMLRSGSGYANFKSGVKNALEKVPVFGKPISKLLVDTKTSIRRTIYDGTLFEELGFRYIGPVDGNDIHEMCYILSNLKETKGPILLHAITSKGKGYRPAEENPGAYHGIDGSVSAVDVTGDAEKETYSTVFGKTLSMLADEDDRICAVTAAMKYGTGLNFFAHAHRNRFYDTGITEEHAAAFCAGLAKEGRKPVFAVYSTFMQRCYDQMFQELVLNDADVLLAVDRAGFVGQDGETHNGLLDPAMLSSLGRIYTVSPASFSELKYWLERLIDRKGPKAIRYP